MFFLKLLVIGVAIGLIGYFILERVLKKYLTKLSFGKQLTIVFIFGLLFIIIVFSTFVNTLSDVAQIDAEWLWVFMLPSILSIDIIVFLFVIVYVVMIGGYNEFLRIADGVVSPLVAGSIGFIFGFIQPQENNQEFFDPELIAVFNFIIGMIAGLISSFFAFLTKKILVWYKV